MGEVLIRHYLIGIIVFTLVIVGGVSMIGIFRESNPSFGDTDKYTQFNRTFNKMDDITTQVNNLENTIENEEPEWGVFGVLNALISSGWNTLKLMFNSLDFMDDAFEGVSSFFGVPAWIPALVSLIVTIIIAFVIYSAIFQRDV